MEITRELEHWKSELRRKR